MKLRFAGVLALSAALAASISALPATASSAAAAQPAASGSSSAAAASAAASGTAASGTAAARAAASAELTGQRVGPLAALPRGPQLPGESRPGTVTGVVRGATGLPVAGACVTAFGTAGAAAARPASTRANDSGRFLLAGLHAGRYTLKFTDCTQPGRYLPRWSGTTGLAATARPLLIGGGQVTRLAPVMLRPASPAALFARPSAAQLARAAGEPAVAAARFGGISGRITDTRGRPVTGTCVEIDFGGVVLGLPVSARGIYSTSRELPPGRYKVEFAATSCGANPGNWAPQWYKGALSKAAATPVRVVAGKVTRHISGRLVHGGILSGTVTSRTGARLTGICVVLANRHGDFVTEIQTRRGRYSLRGLPAARYRVLFAPGCASQSRYLPQWWRDAPTLAKARPVPVRLGATVRGIDARLVAGGTISGTVRFASPAGRPLSGICVDAETGGFFTGTDSLAATNSSGGYRILGLPTGSYSVQFDPGCNNNGNYLSASYPGRIRVTDGHDIRGINAFLRPGATITGVVTGPAGQPIANLAVQAIDPANFNGNGACTSKTGAFRITQLPPGHYIALFSNICGATGNYAPQYFPGQSDPGAAEPMTVRLGQHITGVDAKLQRGATIAGAVTSTAGRPVPHVCVGVQSPGDGVDFAEFGSAQEQVETGRSGSYRVPDLAAGRYTIQFTECGAPTVANRFFGGRPGSVAGDVVNVGAGATVSGASAVMQPGGAIGGDVRTTAGKQAPGICEAVTSLRTGTPDDDGLFLLDSGDYRATGLPLGRYSVEFYGCFANIANFTAQWFSHKSSPAAATPVRVTAGHTTGSVSGTVARGGRISGRLTSRATGKPVPNFCVVALSRDFSGFSVTGRLGNYVVTGLNTATYHLEFSNCDGTTAAVAGQEAARTVHVTAGRTVSGRNAALPAGGSISGVVTAVSGRADICVEADPLTGTELPASATPSHTGRYVMTGLPAGKYRVFFDTRGACDQSPDGLVPQWYQAAATRAAATVITVRRGQDTTGIDAALAADGGLSGQVTAAAGGAPLAGVCVRAVPLTAGRAASFTASADGSYAMTGLIPGTYTVEFSSGCGAAGYARQWWHGASSAAKAAVVTIRPGTVTTGISAVLAR